MLICRTLLLVKIQQVKLCTRIFYHLTTPLTLRQNRQDRLFVTSLLVLGCFGVGIYLKHNPNDPEVTCIRVRHS